MIQTGVLFQKNGVWFIWISHHEIPDDVRPSQIDEIGYITGMSTSFTIKGGIRREDYFIMWVKVVDHDQPDECLCVSPSYFFDIDETDTQPFVHIDNFDYMRPKIKFKVEHMW